MPEPLFNKASCQQSETLSKIILRYRSTSALVWDWRVELSSALIFHALKACSQLSFENVLRICLGSELKCYPASRKYKICKEVCNF